MTAELTSERRKSAFLNSSNILYLGEIMLVELKEKKKKKNKNNEEEEEQEQKEEKEATVDMI